MITGLTNYGPCGYRWSPDHTIRVAPQFESPGMWPDERNRPVGYMVMDTLDPDGTPLQVRTIREVKDVIATILAARPRLEWGPWHRPEGEEGLRRGASALLCTADGPVGRVTARISLREDTQHRGMWRVGFTFDRQIGYNWLSDIRHIPHRELNTRAHATHRVFKTGAAQ